MRKSLKDACVRASEWSSLRCLKDHPPSFSSEYYACTWCSPACPLMPSLRSGWLSDRYHVSDIFWLCVWALHSFLRSRRCARSSLACRCLATRCEDRESPLHVQLRVAALWNPWSQYPTVCLPSKLECSPWLFPWLWTSRGLRTSTCTRGQPSASNPMKSCCRRSISPTQLSRHRLIGWYLQSRGSSQLAGCSCHALTYATSSSSSYDALQQPRQQLLLLCSPSRDRVCEDVCDPYDRVCGRVCDPPCARGLHGNVYVHCI